MPRVAGILAIVSGAIQIAFPIPALLNFVLGMGKRYGIASAVAGELAIIFVPLALSGTLCIVGGIYALKRKRWRLAMAGSIAALFPCVLWLLMLPFYWLILLFSIDSLSISLLLGVLFAFFLALGIAAIRLTSLAKKEFE